MTVQIDYAVERERLLRIAMDPDKREIDHLHPAAVVWDLDSTVADTLHRHHMLAQIRAGESTWDDYSLACIRDTPVEAAVTLMRMLWRTSLQIAVSGRSAVASDLTRKWVSAHKIPLDKVVLRPEGDFRPSDEYKVSEVRKLEEAGITVLLYVDDWPSSATAVTEATGIPALKVNPDYECIVCKETKRACPCGAATIGGRGA